MRYRHKVMGCIVEYVSWGRNINAKKVYFMKVIGHPDKPDKKFDAVIPAIFPIGSIIVVQEDEFEKSYEKLKISEYGQGDIVFEKNGDTYAYRRTIVQIWKNEEIRLYEMKIVNSKNGIDGEIKFFDPDVLDNTDFDGIYDQIKL